MGLSISISLTKCSSVPAWAVLAWGGADLLIYLLRSKSTPISLSTRGAAIPSVSTSLAEHHLTQLPATLPRARQPGYNFSAINGRAVQLARALRLPCSMRTELGCIPT
ncbi:hypothetical protein ACSBR1_005235 [Camellia fascicularis]